MVRSTRTPPINRKHFLTVSIFEIASITVLEKKEFVRFSETTTDSLVLIFFNFKFSLLLPKCTDFLPQLLVHGDNLGKLLR